MVGGRGVEVRTENKARIRKTFLSKQVIEQHIDNWLAMMNRSLDINLKTK